MMVRFVRAHVCLDLVVKVLILAFLPSIIYKPP